MRLVRKLDLFEAFDPSLREEARLVLALDFF